MTQLFKTFSLSFVAVLSSSLLLGDIPQSPSQTITPTQIQRGTTPKAPPPASSTPRPYSPSTLKKPVIPLMTKPFGMPGVIGFQNDKWEGTDYLGYVASGISVEVEVLKGENAPAGVDASVLESLIGEVFTKHNLRAKADVTEGPLFPFLHVLLIVYPVDKDKYAIFGASRLFEQIQVMRKNFSPAGYWQGITWENQDVALATGEQLDAQMKAIVQKLTTAFAERYRLYNPQNPEQSAVQ